MTANGAALEPSAIASIEDLLEVLRGTHAHNSVRWYRGQTFDEWDLTPRVSRIRGHLENEQALLHRFQQRAVSRTRVKPSSTYEWMCLAQHYGLPTRLMDWTESPLVALYFAVEQSGTSEENSRNAAFFALDPVRLNKISLREAPSVLMLDEHEVLNDYLPGAKPQGSRTPVAVIAGRSFDRISAQSGTFTLTADDHHIDLLGVRETSPAPQTLLDVGEPPIVTKYVVPGPARGDIIAALAEIGITASTVYPDLEFIATELREAYA